MKQAVILAGGLGTRLSSVVQEVPKSMASVNNRPFLDYLIELLQKNGFDNFVFLLGYKSEIIENNYKDLNNSVFIKEKELLGTGGALFNAVDYLQNEFFVINGDTFFDIDFSVFEEFSEDKECSVVLKYTDKPERYGTVETDDNYRVISFKEKEKYDPKKIDGYINGGIYYFKKNIISGIKEEFKKQKCSIEKDIFPVLAERKLLYALPVGGVFIDIGIPEDYHLAQKIIPEAQKRIFKPALFIDKDGTIIENTDYPKGTDFKVIPSTVNTIKKYSDKGYYIVMITNQSGIAKNKFTKEEMDKGINAIKEYYKKFDIVFDDIEYCPYHKDGIIDEYRYDTLLRKPNPGMILKACDKLKIDLKNSIMIGDNENTDKIKLPYLKSEIIKGH